MNDIRRTILWVIFGFSMVLLWDQWQVYNGHKATFFPSPASSTAAKAQAPASAPVGAASVPAGSAAATNSVATPAQVPGTAAPGAGAAPARERIQVTTDVLKLTFDSEGG